MFWVPLIMAGMSMAQGMNAQADAKIQKATDKSNTRVRNIQRLANNKLAAAQGSLARYTQSRNNQQQLKAGGNQLNAITTNLIRTQEAGDYGRLSARINQAEENGALAAKAGALGMGGATVQMLNATVNLRQQMATQMSNSQEKQQVENLLIAKTDAIDSMILGLSNVQYNDEINMMEHQEQRINVPSTGMIAANAAMTFASAYAQFGGGLSNAGPGTVNLQGQAKPLTSNVAFVRNM